MTSRRWNPTRNATAIGAALWLLGSACAGEHSALLLAAALAPRGASSTCSRYLADVENQFHLDADTSVPGSSPPIVFDMSIPGASSLTQILLTHDVVITLPASFGFAGFGSAGAPIGSWQFEWYDPNGTFDPSAPSDYRHTIPHYAVDADHGYADTLLNGAYDGGIDSTVAHATGGSGEHVFTIAMPSGGTNNGGFDPSNPCSYFDADTRFTLPAGIVTLPQTPGDYDVTIVATSVDPDTGDANDQQGTPPTVYQRTAPIHVPEPAPTLAGAAATLAVLARRFTRRGR